jgi:hypothetical protein
MTSSYSKLVSIVLFRTLPVKVHTGRTRLDNATRIFSF